MQEMAPTKAFAQVRLFVNEYFCGDDIAKGHEHLHEVLVTELLRQMIDEQVGSVGTCHNTTQVQGQGQFL